MDYNQHYRDLRNSSPIFMEYSVKMCHSGFLVYENWTYDSFSIDAQKAKGLYRFMPRYFRNIPQEFNFQEVKELHYEFGWWN